MYLKLGLLQQRDYDLEIYEFKKIGFIEYVFQLIITKTKKWKLFRKINNTNYDILFLLMRDGYISIPHEDIMYYIGRNIKKEIIFTKNVANEMYYTKYLLKI